MGKDALRADIARIIELARQAEAAGTPINKSAIAHVVKRDRGFVIRTLREWEAAGKPNAWPAAEVARRPAIAYETQASAQPAPDIYAAFLEFAKQHGLPIGNGIAQPPPAPEKPAAPAIFAPKRFSRVAFLSDIHTPFENKLAVRITLDFLADYKPDVILLAGDIYDFLEISDYDKSPSRITTLQDEFDEGRYLIKAIDQLAPEVHFLIGNHEDRLSRLISRNPGLFKLRSLDIAKAAELPEHWRVHPSQTHFKLGKLTALHGDIKGVKSAVHPARTLFQKLKRSCVFGHFHRFGNHLDTNYDGEVRGGFANGHLSDVSRVTSWVTCPDWQEGFSTISLCEDGGFAVQQRLVMHGRLIAEGKEYTL